MIRNKFLRGILFMLKCQYDRSRDGHVMKKLEKIPSDLLLIIAWTILTLIFVLTPFLQDTFIRTILGIPMVLFLPGYALIAALFPKKDELNIIERIALSFGLSIAVVPLLGLILNFTFGIKLVPILFSLCIFTLALGYIAAFRREGLPEDKRFSVNFYKIYEIINNEIRTPKSRNDRILTAVLIFSIILAAGMIFFVITTPKMGERFTEFYILDPDGKADNYPTNLTTGSPENILAGVNNHEYIPVNYTIRVALDNEILTETGFILGHNNTWENNVTFVPEKEGKDMKLEFLLFKENNFTEPYRELHLWVDVAR